MIIAITHNNAMIKIVIVLSGALGHSTAFVNRNTNIEQKIPRPHRFVIFSFILYHLSLNTDIIIAITDKNNINANIYVL